MNEHITIHSLAFLYFNLEQKMSEALATSCFHIKLTQTNASNDSFIVNKNEPDTNVEIEDNLFSQATHGPDKMGTI